MKNVPLSVEKRQVTGSGKLNKIRHQGYIPGIIYGRDMEATPIQIKESILSENMRHHGQNTIFNIDMGNNEVQTAIIRELQVDQLKKEYLHVDLQQISLDEKREAHVPIRVVGKSKTESRNSVYIQSLEHITVEGLPRDIPEYIEVNVSHLEVGDTFTVSELVMPDTIDVINNSHDVIVSLSPTRAVAEDLNPKDDTSADEVPIIGNDERETKAT